ncbi:MAG TPA: hypothetical protein VHB02_06035 [Acidimicrobiales bacterium]|nr:hypothetical protein [Acidimicrobiales bacterium]
MASIDLHHEPGYVPNHEGFAALAVSDEIRSAVRARTEQAEALAIEFSADFVSDRHGDGQRYIDSFETYLTTAEVGEEFPHESAVGVLKNTAPWAAAVEWGNSHAQKPHRVFGRVVDALSDD